MKTKVALVTGANRGIGFEVCRQLAQKGVLVILTSRDKSKGAHAAHQLSREGLGVVACELDVRNEATIQNAREFVETEYGHLDILINNAGGNYDSNHRPLGSDLKFARETFELNFFGAWAVCQIFYPLLRKSAAGRIVNVSSEAGSFQELSHYRGAAASYGLSKLALNGLTKKLAAEVMGSSILVNSVCPGYTVTDLTDHDQGARPVEEGAAGIVWVALLPNDGPTGLFFHDTHPIPW